MLRKTLVTLTAVAALGVGSAAMARGGGGWGGSAHVGGWGGGGWGGSAHVGGWGGVAMHGVTMGHTMHGVPMMPMTRARVQSMGVIPNHFAWNRDHFHDHFHHRFHNRFFAFGFGGPYLYDYAYNCWTRVPTRYGWQWIYACGGNEY
jgi:hypothetical protein